MANKNNIINKIILLAVVLLAAFMVVQGGKTSQSLALAAYTVGFGILVVAGIIMMILGYEALDSRVLVVLAALIPLGISLGMVSQFFPGFKLIYSLFCTVGIIAIAVSRWQKNVRAAAFVLAFFHGISGLVIFLLPVYLQFSNAVPVRFLWVSLGGLIMGLGGLLHLYVKAGSAGSNPRSMARFLPLLLLITTAAFVLGFTSL